MDKREDCEVRLWYLELSSNIEMLNFSHPPNPKQVYLVQDNHGMILSWQVWREG